MNVRRKIDTLGMARLAMHGQEEFVRQVRDLIDLVEIWERPQQTDEQVLANWNTQIEKLRNARGLIKPQRR